MRSDTVPYVIWNAHAAAGAAGGKPVGEWNATGVSIDTRTLKPGDLFIAIQGVAMDGHAFAARALEKGAAAVVVIDTSDAVPAGAPAVRVVDTMAALEGLARAARDRSRAQIVAVTGSVGKTGTKDTLAGIFSRLGICHASEGNLNNHWGLPLTLARMPAEASFAVLEMGMNHPGEIRPLSKMARPHVALITAIELVHSEFFSSVEEIADAKAEIFEGLEPDGTAVLNHDNPMYDRLASTARAFGVGNIVSFGRDPAADVRLTDLQTDGSGSDVQACVFGTDVAYRVAVPGTHWAMNTLGVLAVAATMELDLDAATETFARLTPPKGRGSRIELSIPGGALTLIDESYNASPVAVAAAIDVLGMTTPGDGGRRIAVLGDMLELGDQAQAMHSALAEPLLENEIDTVFTAGPTMASLFDALPRGRRGGHAETSDHLAPFVTAAVKPGDVVLVKGSFGSRMGVVIDALKALADAENTPIQAVNGN